MCFTRICHAPDADLSPHARICQTTNSDLSSHSPTACQIAQRLDHCTQEFISREIDKGVPKALQFVLDLNKYFLPGKEYFLSETAFLPSVNIDEVVSVRI